DHLEREPLDIQREALGTPREQHLLAGLEPQLLVTGGFASGERPEDIAFVEYTIVSNFDEARAAMRMRGLEHVRQILVDVDAASNEPRTRSEREHAWRHRPVDRAERSRGRARADAAGRRVLALCEAIDLVVEQQDLAIEVATKHMHRVVAA